MGNDVDDAMALCMIHSLQQRGAVELLAVTVTKDHPQAAARPSSNSASSRPRGRSPEADLFKFRFQSR
jgi:hypothetical protein